MSDRLPFFLHEALVSLFVADSSGNATGAALWSGAYANGLHFSHALEEVAIKGSGEAYATARHVDEENVITIDRTWLLRKTDLTDFIPARNQQYVLQITWTAGRYTFQRTFYGVTGRTIEQRSQGTNHSLTNQVFRAKYFTDAAGGAVQPIVPAVPVNEQPVGFFREEVLLTGDYLLGFYRWTVPVLLTSAKVIAWAPQVSPVVLTLEVGGVLTAKTLTIPVGTANTETGDDQSLGNYGIGANTVVRWQITSAPAAEFTAWKCALLLQAVLVG